MIGQCGSLSRPETCECISLARYSRHHRRGIRTSFSTSWVGRLRGTSWTQRLASPKSLVTCPGCPRNIWCLAASRRCHNRGRSANLEASGPFCRRKVVWLTVGSVLWSRTSWACVQSASHRWLLYPRWLWQARKSFISAPTDKWNARAIWHVPRATDWKSQREWPSPGGRQVKGRGFPLSHPPAKCDRGSFWLLETSKDEGSWRARVSSRGTEISFVLIIF